MDRHTSWKELLLIVTNVIEHLSLSHRADTQLSALSGGQRKRLGLANQVIIKYCALLFNSVCQLSKIRTEEQTSADSKAELKLDHSSLLFQNYTNYCCFNACP